MNTFRADIDEIRRAERPDAAQFVVLEVVGDGPGILAELRDRVFEAYFTTKTTGPERGAGLGLATVFGIAESHGGSVEIRWCARS